MRAPHGVSTSLRTNCTNSYVGYRQILHAMSLSPPSLSLSLPLSPSLSRGSLHIPNPSPSSISIAMPTLRAVLAGAIALLALACEPSLAFSSPAQRVQRAAAAAATAGSSGPCGPRFPPRPVALPSSRSSSSRLAALPPAVAWAACHIIGGCSGTAFVIPATRAGGWYRKIDLPPWTPPDRIFGPVWTVLYGCMGVAASRVFLRTAAASASSPAASASGLLLLLPSLSLPLRMWFAHYALNLAWAPLFFGAKRLRAAMVTSVLLVATLVPTVAQFLAVDRAAGLLLLPYLGWVTFATFLNGEICRRNPTDGGGYNSARFQAGLLRLQADAARFADS